MAKAAGVAASTVRTIWQAHGLTPRRWRLFKLSNDPAFADKPIDIVGLYVAPPAHAVVLSIDEKTQIQTLDGTQPGLPLKKGRCATMTHDDKRHGTTTLFAALNVLDSPPQTRSAGTIGGRHAARHRHREFLKFLDRIDRTIPAGTAVHAILDNDVTHEHAKVRAWLAKRPRWTFHFIPISCSWLNAVEGFLARLTRRRPKHDAFCSVGEFRDAIHHFIDEHNAAAARPFFRVADPEDIIAARKRGFQTLRSMLQPVALGR